VSQCWRITSRKNKQETENKKRKANMKKALFIIASLLVGGVVIAAPLTSDRNTAQANGNQIVVGVYTNVKIYAGGMLAVNSSGYAVEAANASGYKVIGRADRTVDNTLGASGALNAYGRSGSFYWDGDASSLTKAAIGQVAYVVDDHTVSLTNSGSYNTIAGIVKDYDSVKGQVCVDTYNLASSGASTPATLAVAGAATVGATLGVTGVISGNGSGITNIPISIVGGTGIATNIAVTTAYPVVGGATGSVLFVTGVTIQTRTVTATNP
jgi:hypothetical protein